MANTYGFYVRISTLDDNTVIPSQPKVTILLFLFSVPPHLVLCAHSAVQCHSIAMAGATLFLRTEDNF